LKRIKVIAFSFHVAALPVDALRRLHPEISGGFSKNERIPILRYKPIGSIKR